MASEASQLIEEVTAHAQMYSLADAREICADGSYFQKNLITYCIRKGLQSKHVTVNKFDKAGVVCDS